MPRISRVRSRLRRAVWIFLAVLLAAPATHAGEGPGTAAEAKAMVEIGRAHV